MDNNNKLTAEDLADAFAEKHANRRYGRVTLRQGYIEGYNKATKQTAEKDARIKELEEHANTMYEKMNGKIIHQKEELEAVKKESGELQAQLNAANAEIEDYKSTWTVWANEIKERLVEADRLIISFRSSTFDDWFDRCDKYIKKYKIQ